MPSYDFRCKNCGQHSTLFYKTIHAYTEATPTCPNCNSTNLTRIIDRVNVPRVHYNYSDMNPNEMLSVLESGDSRRVGEMFEQITGSDEVDDNFRDVTERLKRGESMDSIEEGIESGDISLPDPGPASDF